MTLVRSLISAPEVAKPFLCSAFCPQRSRWRRSVSSPTARRSEVSALSPPTTTALRRRVPPWHA